MNICFTEEGWEDYQHWLTNDPGTLEKLNSLIENTGRSFFKGLGKPEPLKGELSGWWSRRIRGDHRLIYRVEGVGETQSLIIAACRYHYE